MMALTIIANLYYSAVQSDIVKLRPFFIGAVGRHRK